MAVDQARFHTNARNKRPLSFLRSWIPVSIASALVSATAVFGFDYYSGKVGLIWPQYQIIQTAGGRVIKVPPGGNLQGAVDEAKSGDIVELQAGATYSGQINLSAKPLTDYVTIRSSAVDRLTPGKRVTPEQKQFMATITTGMLGRGAISAANGAHHYRFIGIEFTTSGSMYNYGVVLLGAGESRPENVPHDIEIDRSYIHSNEASKSRRGVALNSANTTIKNSYIEGFAFQGEETQGICGWSGTRNARVLNNYVEGGAENIMFGGADPANAELIPADIEVRGNHLNKPPEWKGKVTTKTLFELKNARRVLVVGNVMTNNWEGSAFRITVRNQDGGAPFSTIEDVTIRDNLINGSGEGINILGRDDTHASQTLSRLNISNNLFLNIGGPAHKGSGYFVQASSGRDILIANNTVMNRGNIATLYGEPALSFVMRDNVLSHGAYGVHGLADLKSEQARGMFRNNVVMNLANVSAGDLSIPPGNLLVNSLVDAGLVNAGKGDYAIARRDRVGCDVTRIPAQFFK